MRRKKHLLYPIKQGVPLKVIKDAYDNLKGRHGLPPLTEEIVLDLYLKVLEEERNKNERKETEETL